MHLEAGAQEWNEEVQNHSFADYGPNVPDMNKTDKSNVIENIFLDLLVPNFFGRWRHLAANHFFVFTAKRLEL